jgi:hypothetical protein
MRSVNRLALAAAAVVTMACGDYSTEDIRFLAALPTHADLAVAVPAQADAATATTAISAQALSACTQGRSETWLWSKPTSDRMNASVGFLLGLVDVVRRFPPGWREQDARGWGPFPDEQHPGREVRVVLARDWPDGPDAPPRYAYVFQARVAGTVDWTAVLAGEFRGASATRGTGGLVLDFDALWTLGMADPDAPHGKLTVQYDRSTTPVAVDLTLDEDGLGLQRLFRYRFRGWPDGAGVFAYAFRNDAGDVLTVQASFGAAGEGRGAVGFRTAGGFTGDYQQCWDAAACLVYVLDPSDYSCGAAGCSFGTVDACPAVPSAPF